MNFVRLVRVAKGYSLDDMAGTMRTYPTRIWRLELGLARPTTREMWAIGDILEVGHEVLFCTAPYSDPKWALAVILSILKSHQQAKAAKLIQQARERIGMG